MPDDAAFADLMARLRDGDEGAAEAVFRRFARRLIGLAASRLQPTVRIKVDPEEVVQSVFRSFFCRHAEGQFELADWDGLWGLLARITSRKCARKNARFHAPGRDVRKELAVSPEDRFEVPAREPTPDDATLLLETLEQALRGLDARERDMVLLRLQGHSTAEVSLALACTERKVQRVLERVRRRLEGPRTASLPSPPPDADQPQPPLPSD